MLTLTKDTTEQEVFDYVAKFLLAQGEPSIKMIDVPGFKVPKAVCQYHLHKNDGRVLKCAAGCLIPDDEYDISFEGERFSSIRETIPVFNQLSFLVLGFINALQLVHDATAREQLSKSEWETKWTYRMIELAVEFDLNSSVFDKLKE